MTDQEQIKNPSTDTIKSEKKYLEKLMNQKPIGIPSGFFLFFFKRNIRLLQEKFTSKLEIEFSISLNKALDKLSELMIQDAILGEKYPQIQEEILKEMERRK